VELDRQTIEIERQVANESAQALVRAEATVSGAGREAVEPLMEEATLSIGAVEVQEGRVLLDGTVRCQAVYRLGEEGSPRALAAQAQFSQSIETPGAKPRMIASVSGEVEHVEASYENGRMVFLVSINLNARVSSLDTVSVITQVAGVANAETRFEEICSTKLSAEAGAETMLRESVALPSQLDARLALIDWCNVRVSSVEQDLGGVRVKGDVMTETLIGTGIPARPAALVKVTIAFDELVELPEWLTENVRADAEVTSLNSNVEQGGSEESALTLEAGLNIRVRAYGRDCATALSGAYTTSGPALGAEQQVLNFSAGVTTLDSSQTFRGTLLLPEGAPGAGTVIATRIRPVVSEWSTEGGQTTISGILEAGVLYLPGGSERLQAARSEIPFTVTCEGVLPEGAAVRVEAVGAESSALMSDRLEIKCTLQIFGSAMRTQPMAVVDSLEEVELEPGRSGILIVWPQAGDTAWTLGERHRVAQARIGAVEAGKPVVLRV
jgi:hypothetical protein